MINYILIYIYTNVKITHLENMFGKKYILYRYSKNKKVVPAKTISNYITVIVKITIAINI